MREENARGWRRDALLHGNLGCREAEKRWTRASRISFSGIVTFKSAADLQETARKVPLDRMLIETDSPYLARCRTAARPASRPGCVT
ncbi:TatD family hydrolase [Cupriavidus basilensis]